MNTAVRNVRSRPAPGAGGARHRGARSGAPARGAPTAARVTPEEREEQRAGTMSVLRRMARLAPGDEERARLREEVVADHMPYARHIARRYSHRRDSSVEDLEQVAYLGLVKAVDNFDPEHGTGFLGYATPMIVGEIKRYYRDATWDVHVPRHMQEVTGALHKAADALLVELGRAPTIAELAGRVGACEDEVVEALDASEAYRTASLDHPAGAEEDGATVGELIGGDDPGYELTVDREVLRGLVARLCERDKRILLLRYFRGLTQARIGEELGISQMQVSRLLGRIVAELRDGFGCPPPDARVSHVPDGTDAPDSPHTDRVERV